MRGRTSRFPVRPARSVATVPGHAYAARRLAVPGAVGGTGLPVPLTRGPYQNNGATPWYATLSLGSPGQPLKIALDTGANFIWCTSSLCGANGCVHYAGGQFVYQNSASFQFLNQTPQQVEFGPWGSMNVESGSDIVSLAPGATPQLDFFLSASYSGSQFEQLDWDGGIGIPSGSAYVDQGVSFSIAALMNGGFIDPTTPYVSFLTDPANGAGTVIFGGVPANDIDPRTGVFLPWTPYTAFAGVEYIWTTPLYQYFVGETLVATNVEFCLDSGSSQFKGDDSIMNRTLQLIGSQPVLDVLMTLGSTLDGAAGQIVVPPSVYMVTIEAGPQQGQVLPQFNPLGLTDLVLVGSVVMDQLCTVYVYDVADTANGYYLSPVGMWIFNKTNGPQLIQSKSSRPFVAAPRPIHTLR
jgi:saccharopepsin